MNRKTLFLILIFMLIGFSIIYLSNRQDGGVIRKTEEVELYFSTKDAMYLQAELRQIDPGNSNKYIETINGLINGPESKELNRTIPDGVVIRDIKVEDKVAYLNFNQALVDNHWGGSTGEIMTVFSIVNTITQFPEIEYARILVEGKEIETLAGHLDTSMALKADENLVKK